MTGITHLRVIDGTGAPGKDDQTVFIQDGRIRAVGNAGTVSFPGGAHVIDGRGRRLMPGSGSRIEDSQIGGQECGSGDEGSTIRAKRDYCR